MGQEGGCVVVLSWAQERNMREVVWYCGVGTGKDRREVVW
jgi:hypothetical protein